MWYFHIKNSFVISSQLLSVTFSFSLFFPSFRSLSIRFSRAVYGQFFLDKCYLHTAPLLTLFLYWGWTGSVVKTISLNNGFNDRVSKVQNGTDIYLSKYSEGAGHKLDADYRGCPLSSSNKGREHGGDRVKLSRKYCCSLSFFLHKAFLLPLRQKNLV